MKNIIFIQDINIDRERDADGSAGLSHIHGRTWSKETSPYKYSTDVPTAALLPCPIVAYPAILTLGWGIRNSPLHCCSLD